jgi:hypothetical protein
MVVRPKRLARYDDPAWLQQLSWLHCLGRPARRSQRWRPSRTGTFRATTRLLTGLGEHVPNAVPLSTERARSYFILNSCDRTIVSADARMANDEERDLLDLGPATCSDDAALLQLPAH